MEYPKEDETKNQKLLKKETESKEKEKDTEKKGAPLGGTPMV
jgi:hypothetical protein